MKNLKLCFSCTITEGEGLSPHGRFGVLLHTDGFASEADAMRYGDWLHELLSPRADEIAAKFLPERRNLQ